MDVIDFGGSIVIEWFVVLFVGFIKCDVLCNFVFVKLICEDIWVVVFVFFIL